MAKEIDVYREWLGITETTRPLNYYQLLRLKPFDDDTSQIRTNYRKMNEHVRRYATGEFADASQQLLNELAKAMLCLTDLQRKREYDAAMGRADKGEYRRRTFEEILLAGKVLDQAQLDKARSFAKAVGLEVRDAVLQQKLATADVVMLAYAESVGLPYVELEDVGVDEQLARQIPPPTARQHSCIPVMADQDQILMASPNPLVPDVEEDLRLRLGMPVRTVLCTPAGINTMIAKYYPRDAAPAAPVSSKPSTAEKAPSPKTRPRQAMSEEEQEAMTRRQWTVSIIAFTWTVILCMIALVFLRGGMTYLGKIDFVLALFLAVAAAAVAFVLTPRFSR